ncbi:uncharacterized protein LOC144173456 [Haemaphysalis longicornis]
MQGMFIGTNMFFLSIYIGSHFFLLGMGLPQPRDDAGASEAKPKCIDQNAVAPSIQPKTTYVFDCNCTQSNGEPGIYPDKTRCWREDFGYNKERSMEEGRCYFGDCVLVPIKRGCAEMTPRMHQLEVTKQNAPTGCTFRCGDPDKNTLEYGYYKPGVPCWHTTEGDNVMGICTEVGDEVLCKTKPHGC